MRGIILVITLFFLSAANSQELRVGLFHKYTAYSYSIQVEDKYHLWVDSMLISSIPKGQLVKVTKSSSGKVSVAYRGDQSRSGREIVLSPTTSTSEFQITASGKVFRPTRKYQDGISFHVDAKEGNLRAVNLVRMQNYLAGVMETEAGGNQNLEYYKVQAVMSRTFAYKNQYKHKDNGYQLCDATHCQAYYSKMRYQPIIKQAVQATEGEVVIDKNFDLISGFFHANCGGQTVLSSFVWNKDVPYLKSVSDPFCRHTHQSNWTKEIPSWTWYKYLRDNYDAVDDSAFKAIMYNYTQDNREMFYISNTYGIPLKQLRTDFELKSAFFSIEKQNDKLILKGKGFGHGVGLCQEGAMNMSKTYNYKQIIQFYFNNVLVVPYNFVLSKPAYLTWDGW